MPTLSSLPLPWKLLITLFLIVLSAGFAVSELYLMHTAEMADGKEGMSLDDITITFHGDKTRTRLRSQATGAMKKYFSAEEEPDKLTDAEQVEFKTLLAWNDAGAPESEFWDKAEKSKKPGPIFTILDTHCMSCHSPEGMKKDDALDTFAGVSKFTEPDTGIEVGRLLMLSHVHLLGMGMMFLLVGAAVAMSSFPTWMRCTLIVGGLSSILFDIFGWWGVKYFGAGFSPIVMLGGVAMVGAFAGSVFVAMYDMWVRKRGMGVPPMLSQ